MNSEDEELVAGRYVNNVLVCTPKFDYVIKGNNPPSSFFRKHC